MVSLRTVAAAQKKRLASMIEEKKKVPEGNIKRANQAYQDELKNKIKLLSMIGGQVYKKISDKIRGIGGGGKQIEGSMKKKTTHN